VLTFGFDKFKPYIGPGVSPSERTKSCSIRLIVDHPTGYRFGAVETTWHGFAVLEPYMTASFSSTYFFSNTSTDAVVATRTEITGGGVWASGQVYTKSEVIPASSVVKSPCGATATLNINNRIALTSSSSEVVGRIASEDPDVPITQQVRIDWYTC
jgi:hypothetical protein